MDGSQIIGNQRARQVDPLTIICFDRSMEANLALRQRRQISIARQRDYHSTRTISPRTFIHRANNLNPNFHQINN